MSQARIVITITDEHALETARVIMADTASTGTVCFVIENGDELEVLATVDSVKELS